jgi:hypothetical protein
MTRAGDDGIGVDPRSIVPAIAELPDIASTAPAAAPLSMNCLRDKYMTTLPGPCRL